MNTRIIQIFSIVLGVFLASCGSVNENKRFNPDETHINTLSELKSLFKDPPNHYRSAPLWVWNDDVSEKQIDEQLADLKKGGMGGVFIHPRPGLITSYLSDEWFELCNYTVNKGKELGMDVWLYDENSYPSGFAGGHVPAEMPESYNQGQGLELKRETEIPADRNDIFLALKKVDEKFIDITNNLDKESGKTGDYYLYKKTFYQNQAWHGGFSYVDLLYEGVTEKFIEVTMTGYEKAIGNEFGKTVPGIFTDEPNISSPGGIRWTPSLFEDFEKRWGYDLRTSLPSLSFDLGDWKKVRHNYYTTLLELFIERWSKPWCNYTEENNLQWTGHYWEHGWPNPTHGSDNMAMYAWHQVPAIDILMNQFSETVNAQFGNIRAVKELSSVANQMGRTRALSETYGAGGWDLRFEDMKRIGDWQYVLGVNFLNQHLSYMTLEGARKRDHPQSFSYHEPWWKNYKIQGDYFARLSLALASGKQINKVLVIEPTTSAWMYFSELNPTTKFSEFGPKFQDFVTQLERNQIEYDLGAENMIKDIGKIKGENFIVGECSYDVVVIPPALENLDQSTFNLIKAYLKNGGKVLSFNGIPAYVDGKESVELKTIAENHSNQWISATSISETHANKLLTSKSIQFKQAEKNKGKLFHNRRNLSDGQLLFLVNTDDTEWASGTFTMEGKSVKELDLINGEIKAYKSTQVGNSLEVEFEIPPSGSLLLTTSDLPEEKDFNDVTEKAMLVKSNGDLKIERQTPNVLTLDYCDITFGATTEKNTYYFQATDKLFKHHGFEGNPWSSAVQYKTSIIDKNNFDANSGFEVSYQFSIDKALDKSPLKVVIEHPGLYQLAINGKNIKPDLGNYWLDRKFGIYSIGDHTIKGENQITLTALSMTIHSEIEAIYLLGDFNLEPQEEGFKIVPSKPIQLGSWKEQGNPFYSDAISYTKSFNVQNTNKRFVVKLLEWNGSLAEVKVNDKLAGTIFYPPYELDITDQIKDGNIKVSVEVKGTLKNLLGPHHIGPVTGTAWPASFASADKNIPPGIEYDFIDYGLFQDFILIEAEGPERKIYWRTEQVVKPVFNEGDSISFNMPIKVAIFRKTEGANIRYTLDGSTPNRSSKLYTGPFTLKKSAIVSARSFKDEAISSSVSQRKYFIVNRKKENIESKDLQNGLVYHYYEGTWSKVPDFSTLIKVKEGKTLEMNLETVDRRGSFFAINYIGYIKIEQEGIYNFYVSSNDGSKLYVNEIPVVDNDGTHGDFEKRGKIHLKVGYHPLKLQYFDGGGSQALRVSFKGPGSARQIIPSDMLFHRLKK